MQGGRVSFYRGSRGAEQSKQDPHWAPRLSQMDLNASYPRGPGHRHILKEQVDKVMIPQCFKYNKI